MREGGAGREGACRQAPRRVRHRASGRPCSRGRCTQAGATQLRPARQISQNLGVGAVCGANTSGAAVGAGVADAGDSDNAGDAAVFATTEGAAAAGASADSADSDDSDDSGQTISTAPSPIGVSLFGGPKVPKVLQSALWAQKCTSGPKIIDLTSENVDHIALGSFGSAKVLQSDFWATWSVLTAPTVKFRGECTCRFAS